MEAGAAPLLDYTIAPVKAIVIHEDGGPEVLSYEDARTRSPPPARCWSGCASPRSNHLDVWTRKGMPSVPKPRILGADGSGVVEALGEGVEGLEPGQPVVINPGLEHGAAIHVIGEHTQGVHAELAAIPGTNVYPLRDGVSFEDAAAFPLVYETAYRMLVTRAGLQAGEQVLIWGIGGGVAMAAFRIAQALGAKTIVTSSSDAKLVRAAELGADVTVNHESGDIVATVKESGGADVVVETVGDSTWKRSLDAVRPGGRVTVCGATSGPNPPAALHRVWWKQIDILGSTMGTRADFEGAYDLVAAGATPVIDSTFPLAEAGAAHERLEAGEQFGKILLQIGD